jgi:uncharacterized membrane protein (UPF0127 family)
MWDSETKLIVNLSRGTIVCEHGVIADRALPRMRGLLGRSELLPGAGLLLAPAPMIHTAFMRFAIDAVFLDSDLRVIKLEPDLEPWRTAGASGARAVLELAAGEIARLGLEVGHQLETRGSVVRQVVWAPPPAGRTAVAA